MLFRSMSIKAEKISFVESDEIGRLTNCLGSYITAWFEADTYLGDIDDLITPLLAKFKETV